MRITSTQNPRIKQLAVWQRKRREREAAGVVLVEGHDELAVAAGASVKVRELYVCRELMGEGRDEELVGRIREAGAEVFELDQTVFEKAAYREGADGWLAVAEWVPARLEGLAVGERPLILVTEGVEKPGNVGAMLRTAAAAGVDVVACIGGVDLGNPNVVRASKGLVFALSVVQVETVGELVAWLRALRVRLVAAALDERAREMWSADLVGEMASGQRGVAIAVGEEHGGLSAELLAVADETVIIPMMREMDSLNVATSAAVLLYEAVRQRRVV